MTFSASFYRFLTRLSPEEKQWGILLLFIALRLIFGWITLERYGYHHDELLSLAASSRLQLGYLGGPGFYHWFLALIRYFLGDSITAIRIVVPLLGALNLFLIYKIQAVFSRDLRVLFLVLLLCSTTPFFLGMNSYYNEHLFDQLVWLFAIYHALMYLKNRSEKHLLWIVLALAFGMLIRLTILWLAVALLVSFLFTRRIRLLSPYIGYGVLLMGVASLPFLLWQYQNEWVIFNLLSQRAHPVYHYTWASIIGQNLLVQNPVMLPVWLSCILAVRNPKYAFAKPLLFAVAGIIGVILLLKPSSYNVQYVAVLFPVLAAIGLPVFLELLDRFHWIKKSYFALVGMSLLILIPVSAPVLSLDKLHGYTQWLSKNVTDALDPIPPHFSMMMQWPELYDHVRVVYESLPDEKKEDLVIVSANLGVAGALDFFGKDTLPPVVSWHHEFWIWNEPLKEARRILFVDVNRATAERFYDQVQEYPVFYCELCVWRRETTIYLGMQERESLFENWKEMQRI